MTLAIIALLVSAAALAFNLYHTWPSLRQDWAARKVWREMEREARAKDRP